MAAVTSRLAVDLSGGLIRVLDGTMGGPMRCGSSGLPAGAMDGGRIKDPSSIAQALKQLLARTEITETRAMIAASDTVATFRILDLPPASTEKEVGAAVAKDLPLDPERMATTWFDLVTTEGRRTVYAAAWNRSLVRDVTDSVKLAGLEATVVDLKSACIARAVSYPACVVVDLSADPVEIVLVDGHMPQLWHVFDLKVPFGEDIAPALAPPLRSVLRFHRRHHVNGFGGSAPILISGEQVLPVQVMTRLAELVEQPVMALPAPARIPPHVRHTTYLTCLGLIMRRA
ncbi:MAG: type IV pilus biogenesis protein PilM [Candidatus Dormibacteraceae bacterium]